MIINLKKQKSKKAYITIMTVISISAISVSLVIGLIYSGISSNRDSALNINSSLAKYYADYCAEEVLQKIQEDKNYSGTLNLSFDYGTCAVNTIRNSESSFELQATGISKETNKKIEVIINQTSPKINIISWEEID